MTSWGIEPWFERPCLLQQKYFHYIDTHKKLAIAYELFFLKA